MISTRLALIGSFGMLAVAPACQSKSTGPVPTAAKQTEAKRVEAKQAAPLAADGAQPSVPVADGGSPPREIPAPGGDANPAPTVPTPEPDQALGAQLADPRWFRKTMFGEGAKVLDTKRSQADDQGRFSSLIRFELPDTTIEACAEQLQQKVADDVSNLEREVQPDGRIQLKGSTDRYSLTFICGQAQGKTIAYVSYQWT